MGVHPNKFGIFFGGQNPVRKTAIMLWSFVFVWMAMQANNLGFNWLSSKFTVFALFVLMAIGLIISAFRQSQIAELKLENAASLAKQMELSYDVLFSNSIIVHTDLQGNITWANEKFLTTYGYTKADIIGSSISRLYPEGENDTKYNEIRSSQRNGQIWVGSTKEITSNGSILYIDCKVIPVRDETGRHVQSVSIRNDQTEFEKIRGIKDLVDHMQDEIYIYDSVSLKMVYCNKKAAACSGWDTSDLDRYTIIDANEQMNEKVFRAHTAPLISGQQDTVTAQAARGDRTGEISTRLHHDLSGRRLFVSIIRDTTERVRFEKAKSDFVSTVSHEIRTPLTSIKGSLLLLDSGVLGDFDEKAKSVINIAARNTDQLMNVVDDILDLQKFRAGQMDLTFEKIELIDFLRHILEMTKGYADIHKVKLVLNVHEGSAPIKIDTFRITQVMSNLLSNAIKYSPENGTVHVNVAEDGEFYRIEVSDNGPGIPEEGVAKIFDAFAQIDSVDGKKRKGTGLGLAISKGIVQAHKGKIGLTSEVGKGTTFFVELPRHR